MTGYSSTDADSGPTPSITGSVGAGTNPTTSIVGSDRVGQISVLTDSDPAQGLIATITFNSLPRNAGNFFPVFSPANVNGFASGINARRIDDSSWGVYRDNVALAATTTYVWNYFIP
jgi:hypothetical protein